ncbi:MAG: aminodeoxychorismate synthase component I [bacterium]|nr:aminodeoxychorismate synthase component I [bacterium]
MPDTIFMAKRNKNRLADITLIENGATSTFGGDPFAELQRIKNRRAAVEHDLIPFTSGGVGWFGYEAGHMIEQLPDSGVDHGLPDICFFFPTVILAHQHSSGRTWQIGEFNLSELEPETELQDNETDIDPTMMFSAESYGDAVETIRSEINAGRVYEVCMTHSIEVLLDCKPWQLFRTLRRDNPAPFASLISTPDCDIISSSPEQFLSLDKNRKITSRPIKGTRPRGKTADQDEQLKNELSCSIKDRAENLMIVDLVRNDIGRVAAHGSVTAAELTKIETYATVFQMVSTIQGNLDSQFSSIDLIKACFPGGSMTGAPKIEAMKMIDELEPVCRGIYSGSIGWLGDNDTLDLNIVIRTCIARNGIGYIGAGGAIVADSDPVAEWEESMAKAQALLDAIAKCGAK